jgi:thiosulfate/3-mercaptopyruvate sulfurtransferase
MESHMKLALLAPLALALAATPARTPTTDAPVVVPPAWLSDHLRDAKLVVVHVGDAASYAAAHIPGARLMPLASFSTTRDGLSTEMPDAAALQEVLETAGISNDSRIIIYAATNPPTLAARLYVTLDYFGLSATTSLLDGGLVAWRAAGRAVATDAPAPTRGTVTLAPRPDVLADVAFVSARLGDSRSVILDARDPRYWTGAERNQQRAARAGRIPSARNVPYNTVVGDSGFFLENAALATLFSKAGVPDGQPVVTYCHVGQQASLLFVAARLLGREARLYDGSFEDWSKRMELRVDSGTPPPH